MFHFHVSVLLTFGKLGKLQQPNRHFLKYVPIIAKVLLLAIKNF